MRKPLTTKKASTATSEESTDEIHLKSLSPESLDAWKRQTVPANKSLSKSKLFLLSLG
jgi:hypothetical protein